MNSQDLEDITEVTIDNSDDLYTQLEFLGLKPAASLQALCSALAAQAIEYKQPSVTVRIAADLIPVSYTGVPAMFARSMAAKVGYAYVQSYVEDGYMVVYAGDNKTPTTFRARVLADLKSRGFFIIKRKRVPKSYRRRPSLLGNILSEELGLKVCNNCKDGKIKWFTAPAVEPVEQWGDD